MTEIITRVVDCHVFHWDNNNPVYLLLKRSNDQLYPGIWQCITGKINPGEEPHETAIRELQEETGLFPKMMWTVDRVNHFFETKNNRMNLIPIFGIEVKSREVKISHEHQSYKWCEIKEGTNMLLWTQQKKGLQSFHNMLTIEKSKLAFTKIAI